MWRLDDLGAARVGEEYLFVFKQHDLHLDHPEAPVTLQTQLNHRYPALADPKTAFGFRHVHQLDYATSGVLCVGLNKKAAGAAAKLFAARLVSKLYLALVDGHPTWERTSCELGVGEDAKDPRGFLMATEGAAGCTNPLAARTEVVVVARGWLRGRPVTKLLLRPQTGRRHQLRVHCKALGHCVVGDTAYSGDRTSERMMLHAWRLRLPLPKARAMPARVICVTTADPFPCAGAAAAAAAAGAASCGRHGGDGIHAVDVIDGGGFAVFITRDELLASPLPAVHGDEGGGMDLDEAVRVLGDDDASFDTDAILDELRPPGECDPSAGDVQFRVLAPAGRPKATPRGQAA